MHYVGYCIKSFVVVSAMGFPDILNYIMHPLNNKYSQEIIAGKEYIVILLSYSSMHCSCHSTINIDILHIIMPLAYYIGMPNIYQTILYSHSL